jgi:hypothetical protein
MDQFKYLTARVALVGLMAIAGAGVTAPGRCSAAEQTRAYLYDKFQNGDIPTQQDFKDMIDSSLNFLDDGLGRMVVTDSTGLAARLNAGVTIGPGLSFTDSNSIAGLSNDWLGNSGFLALSFLESSQLHYGYLQMASTPTPTSPYELFVGYLVFEDQPNVAIATSFVPEPASLALAAFGFAGLAAWGWRRRKR